MDDHQADFTLLTLPIFGEKKDAEYTEGTFSTWVSIPHSPMTLRVTLGENARNVRIDIADIPKLEKKYSSSQEERVAYDEYLQSEAWHISREMMLDFYEHKCSLWHWVSYI